MKKMYKMYNKVCNDSLSRKIIFCRDWKLHGRIYDEEAFD